jgi:hypothetical protein
MHIAALFFITTLVLRSGQHVNLDGPWREQAGRIVFRNTDGTLYSVPAAEVDLEASRAMSAPPLVATADKLRLKVSEEERKRLIQDLERNHAGQPPIPQKTVENLPVPAPENHDEEWTWRKRSRDFQERIRQARENRDLLVSKAEALRSHIAGLVSLGYKPQQFSYDSTQLQRTLEQIPYAELEIQRAQRAWDQFRDDARRLGVMPGWIR